MHQGSDSIERRNLDIAPYDPARIDFFIITHAHIDHSGLLPRMTQNGFRGPIYATEPTGDLLKILLLDSAHIQEVEAAGKNKRLQRTGMKADATPLYTTQDAEAVTPFIKTRKYDEIFSPAPGISVRFQDAGHILGAAMVELFIEENGETSKLVFSGDIGRPNQLLMKDPSSMRQADFLFMESTYGNRNHKGEQESLDELAEAIRYSYKNGEKVVIPAFAVERTQEILYSLHLLLRDGKLPKDMPVYLDSPLAIKATEIFRRYSFLSGRGNTNPFEKRRRSAAPSQPEIVHHHRGVHPDQRNAGTGHRDFRKRHVQRGTDQASLAAQLVATRRQHCLCRLSGGRHTGPEDC
ncbi:MAG: MBL fold metallo-hydrolase [Desulfobacterales bacterium]|nr:MBL fold metallo-hydrolase [Desulfobacterales bacterium]